MTIKFEYEKKGGIPIFTVDPAHEDDRLFRVWGYQRTRSAVIFPALTPFVHDVVQDLYTLYEEEEIEWSPAAQARLDHVMTYPDAIAAQTLPCDIEFALEPFDHQLEALAEAYYNDRWYLNLDMGLGKSKVLIDWLRLLQRMEPGTRTLLAVPPHLIQNWRREINKHGMGEVTYTLLAGEQNAALDPATRRALYRGDDTYDFTRAGRFHADHPTLVYEALVEGLPAEVYDVEDAYVEAIVSGDSDARSKARGKLRRRARKHGFELPSGTWRVIDPSTIQAPSTETDVTIASYDTITADAIANNIPGGLFNVMASDESHYFKSYSSQRSKVFTKISRTVKRVLLMSGSPSAGNPWHVYAALNMLSPILTDGFWRFKQRYFSFSPHNPNIVTAFKNLHILNLIMSDSSTQKTQEDCLDLDIPALKIIDVPYELDANTRSMYNKVTTGWEVWLPEANEMLEVQYATERITKLLQILAGFVINSGKTKELCTGCPHLISCVKEDIKPYSKNCHVEQKPPKHELVSLPKAPKLDFCVGLVEDILQSERNKIIIWYTFTHECEMLSAALRARNITVATVTGTTKNPQYARDLFDTDPACRVYLSQVSISTGFTLNSANYTIYYSLPFDLSDYQQSLKRNHRIGQDKPVTVYRLYAPDTIHEEIISGLDAKESVAQSSTKLIRCGVCDRRVTCAAQGTLPFDPDCKYDRKVKKKAIRPKAVHNPEDDL